MRTGRGVLRAWVAATVAIAIVVTLSGCNSTSLSCRRMHCTMKFSGSNGSKWVDVPHASDPDRARKTRMWFRYQGVRDGRANLIIGDEHGKCVTGQRLWLNGLDLTCTQVTPDSVTFEWTWPNRY